MNDKIRYEFEILNLGNNKVKIFFAVLLASLFMVTGATAVVGDKFDCSVEQMRTRGTDEDFVKQNLEKQFQIWERPKEFIVSVQSPTFHQSQSSYTIVKRDMLTNHGVSVDSFGLETLSIAAKPDSQDEYTKATIAVLSDAFANVWHLKCKLR